MASTQISEAFLTLLEESNWHDPDHIINTFCKLIHEHIDSINVYKIFLQKKKEYLAFNTVNKEVLERSIHSLADAIILRCFECRKFNPKLLMNIILQVNDMIDHLITTIFLMEETKIKKLAAFEYDKANYNLPLPLDLFKSIVRCFELDRNNIYSKHLKLMMQNFILSYPFHHSFENVIWPKTIPILQEDIEDINFSSIDYHRKPIPWVSESIEIKKLKLKSRQSIFDSLTSSCKEEIKKQYSKKDEAEILALELNLFIDKIADQENHFIDLWPGIQRDMFLCSNSFVSLNHSYNSVVKIILTLIQKNYCTNMQKRSSYIYFVSKLVHTIDIVYQFLDKAINDIVQKHLKLNDKMKTLFNKTFEPQDIITGNTFLFKALEKLFLEMGLNENETRKAILRTHLDFTNTTKSIKEEMTQSPFEEFLFMCKDTQVVESVEEKAIEKIPPIATTLSMDKSCFEITKLVSKLVSDLQEEASGIKSERDEYSGFYNSFDAHNNGLKYYEEGVMPKPNEDFFMMSYDHYYQNKPMPITEVINVSIQDEFFHVNMTQLYKTLFDTIQDKTLSSRSNEMFSMNYLEDELIIGEYLPSQYLSSLMKA